ncbi:MarR family winged helix-turn-helix transcriptional regulator [Roseivivax marinus]|uniref:MarR family winged helix-turn-helix transcriptional regulator n=1 Tax=Roseivivax marinus TaxID=1379903 RepID=UPI00273DA0A2|nr:MarR family winged helix-turn-helix transcriptional regulator [Roseivivax marinus]
MSDTARAFPNTERASKPTKIRDGVRILDIENYAPFLLTVVNNAWQRRTSADYRARFGLGVVDWRVLSMLNIEPGITANRVCEVIHMDKAAASRALSNLMANGLLVFEAEKNDPRKRRWWLSEKGQQVHSEIISAAMKHEAKLVENVSDADFETFLAVMRQMLKNLDP